MQQTTVRSPKLATSAQLTALMRGYERGIGYWNAVWYVQYLKREQMTAVEASAEIKRCIRLQQTRGATAVVPQDWEKVRPNENEMNEFKEAWTKRPATRINC